MSNTIDAVRADETRADDVRVGILGCGTIGAYVLEAVAAGKVAGARVVAVAGRSRGRERVATLGINWVDDPSRLLDYDLHVVVEAASHEAVENYGEMLLEQGVSLIPLSLGSLVNPDLLARLQRAAERSGAVLHVPSGGIGGLDALQGAMVGGVKSVTMTSRKPPVAWKGIPYVDSLGLDMGNVTEPTLLFEGPARDCVKLFPQNINIAAALSLAGIGFERTQIRILADPTITVNTHEIQVDAATGRFKITLENVPVPENPKTTYLACASAVASLRSAISSYRVGT